MPGMGGSSRPGNSSIRQGTPCCKESFSWWNICSRRENFKNFEQRVNNGMRVRMENTPPEPFLILILRFASHFFTVHSSYPLRQLRRSFLLASLCNFCAKFARICNISIYVGKYILLYSRVCVQLCHHLVDIFDSFIIFLTLSFQKIFTKLCLCLTFFLMVKSTVCIPVHSYKLTVIAYYYELLSFSYLDNTVQTVISPLFLFSQ